MKAALTIVFATAVSASLACAADKPLKRKDLPVAVQKAIEEQTKGAQVKGFSKEVEKGKTFYEAETIVNGKTRDLLFDPAGALVEVEEEVALDSIPAPARTAIEKAGGGKIARVEKVTAGDRVRYEAAIQKGMKKSEIAVAADGSPAK